MNSKERLLLALNKEKPDRLPATVHGWPQYHLDAYMGGMSVLEAFRTVGLDAQIGYGVKGAEYWRLTPEHDSFNTPAWRDEVTVISNDPDNEILHHTIHTPQGTLTFKTVGDRKTPWITEYLIKHDEDIELIRKYMPVPRLSVALSFKAYDELGDAGILRGSVWGHQPGCWQHAALLYDITDLILAAVDRPAWVHELLTILLDKKLQFIESMRGAKLDLVETGGGSASSTLISPTLHREFCLPYDRTMHDALHSLGFKTTYHTCGGTRGIEDLLLANGCDANEGLAPPSVGGNQEPWELKRKVGNRIALIGGLDQFNTLTTGPADLIEVKVRELFEKVGSDGGYICSSSCHFFDASMDHLRAYAEAARGCRY